MQPHLPATIIAAADAGAIGAAAAVASARFGEDLFLFFLFSFTDFRKAESRLNMSPLPFGGALWSPVK